MGDVQICIWLLLDTGYNIFHFKVCVYAENVTHVVCRCTKYSYFEIPRWPPFLCHFATS